MLLSLILINNNMKNFSFMTDQSILRNKPGLSGKVRAGALNMLMNKIKCNALVFFSMKEGAITIS